MHTSPDEVFAVDGITDGEDSDGNFCRVFWEWDPRSPGVHNVRTRAARLNLVEAMPVGAVRAKLDAEPGPRVTLTVCGVPIGIPRGYVLLHQEMVEEQVDKLARGIPWTEDEES